VEISHCSTEEQKYERFEQFLDKIGIRGILTLLRQRKTAGSIDYFLPSRKQLIDSFSSTHNNQLSVGARALDKHCHRSVTDKFWGSIKGGQKQKNENAADVLNRILDDVSWINAHLLPVCF
jgi:hypothetical protein